MRSSFFPPFSVILQLYFTSCFSLQSLFPRNVANLHLISTLAAERALKAILKLAYLGFPWELISHLEEISQKYVWQSLANEEHSSEGGRAIMPGLQTQDA